MAVTRFLQNKAGQITEVAGGVVSSGGVADAGKLTALDAAGKLDITVMPVGIGADVAPILASENLMAGAFVNVWSNDGAFAVRNADATSAGKQADGFVIAAVVSGAMAEVYFGGNDNTGVSGAVPGAMFLSTVPGGFSPSAPIGSGNVVQRIGVATSPNNINFEAQASIVLA